MNKKDQKMAAESIRARYTMETAAEGELDELIRLDTKIRRPVNVFSYVFGSIASIVMGAGMSLVMTDIGQQVFGWQNSIVPGIVLGVIGLAAALINYPMHKYLMSARKKKYASDIMNISDKIINE